MPDCGALIIDRFETDDTIYCLETGDHIYPPFTQHPEYFGEDKLVFQPQISMKDKKTGYVRGPGRLNHRQDWIIQQWAHEMAVAKYGYYDIGYMAWNKARKEVEEYFIPDNIMWAPADWEDSLHEIILIQNSPSYQRIYRFSSPGWHCYGYTYKDRIREPFCENDVLQKGRYLVIIQEQDKALEFKEVRRFYFNKKRDWEPRYQSGRE